MTAREQELISMYSLLPEQEQALAYELIKRLVLAWDGDFTGVTPVERLRLEQAEKDWNNGEIVDSSAIAW